MTTGRSILLVASHREVTELLGHLRDAGVDESDVGVASTVREAIRALGTEPPCTVILDARSSEGDPMAVLGELLAAAPGCAAVVVGDGGAALDACRRHASAIVATDALALGGLGEALHELSGPGRHLEHAKALAAHLGLLLGAIGEGVLVLSPSGRILRANAAAEAILGYPGDRLRYSDVIAGSFTWSDEFGNVLGLAETPAARALRTGVAVPLTPQRLTRPDGEIRWIECSATPLFESTDRGLSAVVVVFREVTEQRATLAALLGAERRQFLLLEHAAEGYLVLDRRGTVREASASVARFWPVELVIGTPGRHLIHEADRKAMRSAFASVVGGASPIVRREMRLVDASGATRWVELTMSDRLREPTIEGVVFNFRDVTARKLAEESRVQLSAIVESSRDAIVGVSRDGLITSWNPASEQMYGLSEDEVLGKDATIVVAAKHRAQLASLLGDAAAGEPVYVPALDAVRADGSPFELSLSISAIHASDGELVGSSIIARDIAERRQLEQARRVAEERFRLGFEQGAIGMAILTADCRVVLVNAALCELVGRDEGELVGRRLEEFVDPAAAQRGLRSEELLAGTSDAARAELRFARSDGEPVWVLADTAAVRSPDGSLAYLFIQLLDITDRKRSERALELQALHDSLTGLPNRLALERRLALAIGRAREEGSRVAVFFIDVDQFKLVNDGLGHAAGDKLLVEVALRLSGGVRGMDTVARFGGDEFVVVCEDLGDASDARQFGERLLQLLDEPVAVSGRMLHLAVSCGVAIVDGQTSVEDALRDADAAMYRAKARGRARVELFDEGLRRAVRQRFDTEQALRLALERDELTVAYQPILRLGTGEIVGVEALARWRHPERGLLPPAEFIPIAEESGLIVPLGEQILEMALSAVMRFRADLRGCKDLWVSVNLSSRQLSVGDPVALCKAMLARCGAPPSALHLELTETLVMADVESSINIFTELDRLGVVVAIDDFGTGYSSLSYLSRLPVKQLKVDRSLVDGLGGSERPGNSEIFRAIVMLARGLGVEVCAEGVEQPDQRVELERLGCALGQGFLWARPLDAASFERWRRDGGVGDA